MWDKNTLIGIGLIVIIFIGGMLLNKPSEEERLKIQQYNDSIALVKEAELRQKMAEMKVKETEIAAPATVTDSALGAKYGNLAAAVKGGRSFITMENKHISVKFLNQGGRVYSVQLKEYKKYSGGDLILFDGDSTVFGFDITKYQLHTNNLFFVPQTNKTSLDASDEAQSLVYRMPVGGNGYVEYAYTLEPDSYQVKFDVKMVNTGNDILEQNLKFEWEAFMPQHEKGRKWETDHNIMMVSYEDEDYDELGIGDKEKESFELRPKWIAFRQQFFSAVIISDDFFNKEGTMEADELPLDNVNLKRMKATFQVTNTPEWGASFYFGPNHFPTLKDQGNNLHQLIDLGWSLFGWINRFVVIPLFNFLNSFIGNYGLIILILTIVIKVVLFPLTYKSYLSGAKMRVLKPQIDEIGKQYPDKADNMKKQQEVMALYKKAGVNPLGGCLPMLVQMPILFAMFRFFPASIELRQQSFLWAEDLSAYDAVLTWNTYIPYVSEYFGNHLSLFTLLMAISMVGVNQLNSSNMTTAPGQPNMKVMMWIMSVMMLIFFNSYAAGLSYYYLVANLITLGQTFIIRKTVNDEAILAKLEDYKKNPRKHKTKMQRKLEEMAKKKGMH